MIRMSRSAARATGRLRDDPLLTRIVAVWHVPCWMLAAGCFYVKPIPHVDVNDPPFILFPTEDPAPVRVQNGRIVMSIGAIDEEEDVLFFEWPDLDDVPHVLEPFQNGPIQGVRVQVDEPELLRSRIVTALVVDDDPANIVPVRFQVEAP